MSAKDRRLRILMENESGRASQGMYSQGSSHIHNIATVTQEDRINPEDLDTAQQTSQQTSQEKNTELAIRQRSQARPGEQNLALSAASSQQNHNAFCPILAVAKFPYKYISPSISDKVSKQSFAQGKFWNRPWTLYFIYPPVPISEKPLLLVPLIEVEGLLEEIRRDLGLRLEFPNPSREPGFVIDFSDDTTLLPQYLGVAASRAAFVAMESQIQPRADISPGVIASQETGNSRSFEAFKRKMLDGVGATKNKTKASKEKKKDQRIQQKRMWCSQLKRAQRYFGLRPKRTSAKKEDPIENPNLSWQELSQALAHQALANQALESVPRELQLPELDISRPAPCPFDENVIFISVDVESFERDHKKITEIGISTLDTTDIVQLAPGQGGREWMAKIRARHFRIKERLHLVNKDFVIGCGEHFEKCFGESEIISLKDAPQIVGSCFRPPYSNPDCLTPVTALEATPTNTGEVNKLSLGPELIDLAGSSATDKQGQEQRNIVLVGHDIKADVAYLRDLGYDLRNLTNLIEVLDTASLFRAHNHDASAKSLGNLLLDLGLTGWNLHNAGNDAAYTLQALISIAIRAHAQKRDEQTLAAELETRLQEAVKKVEERIIEDGGEWDAADSDSDGGVPVNDLGDSSDKDKEKKENNKAAVNKGIRRGSEGGMGSPSQSRGRGKGRSGNRQGSLDREMDRMGRGRGRSRGSGTGARDTDNGRGRGAEVSGSRARKTYT